MEEGLSAHFWREKKPIIGVISINLNRRHFQYLQSLGGQLSTKSWFDIFCARTHPGFKKWKLTSGRCIDHSESLFHRSIVKIIRCQDVFHDKNCFKFICQVNIEYSSLSTYNLYTSQMRKHGKAFKIRKNSIKAYLRYKFQVPIYIIFLDCVKSWNIF